MFVFYLMHILSLMAVLVRRNGEKKILDWYGTVSSALCNCCCYEKWKKCTENALIMRWLLRSVVEQHLLDFSCVKWQTFAMNSAVWQSCQRVSSYVQGPRTLQSLNGLGLVYLTGCLRICDEHHCQQAEVSIVLTLICAENRRFSVWLVAEWEWAAKEKDSCQPHYPLVRLHAVLWPCLLLSPVHEKSPHQKQQNGCMQKDATERTVLAVSLVSMRVVGT